MRLSSRNWLAEEGSSVDSDTSSCVGKEYQIAPYKGVPMRLFSHGTVAFNLAGARPITCIALLGIRYKESTANTTYSVQVIVRSGGAGGAIVANETFVIDYEYTFELYQGKSVIINEVTGDYVSITTTVALVNTALSFGRIWVGETVELDKVNQYVHSVVNPTLSESNAVGGVSFNDRLMFRTLSISNAEIRDNQISEVAQTSEDLQSVFETFAYTSMNKELAVIPSDGFPPFHARLTQPPRITKGPAAIYFSNIELKEI